MIPLTPAAEDVVARQPVWEALSDMFLDTDTSLSRESRVRLLADSPYTMDQIERILVDEVYPICRANLLSIAGEWAGFDPTWLRARILRRLRSPLRFLHPLNLGRLTVHLSPEWRATRRAVLAVRASGA